MSESISLDHMGVRRLLPHRFPFLLVDRVLECVKGQSIRAIKNVTANEPFFVGHFPHHPVMPGVLIIEALAQSAAILSFRTMNQKPDPKTVYYFVGIDHARFKRPVGPGDTLMLEAEQKRHARNIWIFNCVARVNDAVATEAEIMCTIRSIDGGKAGA